MELFLTPPTNKVELSHHLIITFVKDIGDTFKYLFTQKPFILNVIFFTGCFNLFLAPIYSIGIPYMEKVVFQASNEMYGISEALVGIGAVLGALLTHKIGKKWPFLDSHKYNALFPLGQLIYGYLYDVFFASPWMIYLLAGLCTLIITISLKRSIKNF